MEGELSDLKEKLAARDVSPALAYKPTNPLDQSSPKSSKMYAVKAASPVCHYYRNFINTLQR